ncbi:MAG: hypothetical protein P4L75_05710, partial [Clostridia bacterium]|nr:hypothetical protein [Clostridia bacterium]
KQRHRFFGDTIRCGRPVAARYQRLPNRPVETGASIDSSFLQFKVGSLKSRDALTKQISAVPI